VECAQQVDAADLAPLASIAAAELGAVSQRNWLGNCGIILMWKCEMTARITIPLDADTAKLYTEAPVEVQRKLQVLLSLWVREFVVPSRSLQAIMDEIAQKAQARGLTP
jgi:hypothetical protein